MGRNASPFVGVKRCKGSFMMIRSRGCVPSRPTIGEIRGHITQGIFFTPLFGFEKRGDFAADRFMGETLMLGVSLVVEVEEVGLPSMESKQSSGSKDLSRSIWASNRESKDTNGTPIRREISADL